MNRLIRPKTKNMSFDWENLFRVVGLMSQRNGLPIPLSDANTVQSERPTCSLEQPGLDDGHDINVYLLQLLDKVENLEKWANIFVENTNEKYANLYEFLKKAFEDLNAPIDKVLSQAKTKVTFDDKIQYFGVNDETQTPQRRRSARISTLLEKSAKPASKRASCGVINDDTAAYGDDLKKRRRSCKPDLTFNTDEHGIFTPKRKPKPNSSMVEKIDENGQRIYECAKCSKTFTTTFYYSQHFKKNPH